MSGDPVPWAFSTMAGIKKTVRLEVVSGGRRSISLEHIVRKILAELAGFGVANIFCIQEFPATCKYDISFYSKADCLNFFEFVKEHKDHEYLKYVSITPLFATTERMVTEHMYNPFTDVKLTKAFLANYCLMVRGGVQQKNVFEIFNGHLRFWVKLLPYPEFIGGVMHPPANFSVGGNKGYLYYYEQPHFCRKCFRYGHVSEDCTNGTTCRNCKQSGHEAGSLSLSPTV